MFAINSSTNHILGGILSLGYSSTYRYTWSTVIHPHAVRIVLHILRHFPPPEITMHRIFKVQYTLNWPKIPNVNCSACSTASHTSRSQTLFPWLFFIAPVVYPYWTAFSRTENVKNIKAGTGRGTESWRWFLRLSYKLPSAWPRPSKQCPPVPHTGGYSSLSPLPLPPPTPRPPSEARTAVTSGLPLSSLSPLPGTSLRRRRLWLLTPAAERSKEQEERQTCACHRSRAAEPPAHPARRVSCRREARGPRCPGQGAGHTPAPPPRPPLSAPPPRDGSARSERDCRAPGGAARWGAAGGRAPWEARAVTAAACDRLSQPARPPGNIRLSKR